MTAGARLSTVNRSITWSVEDSPSGLVQRSGPAATVSGMEIARGRFDPVALPADWAATGTPGNNKANTQPQIGK
ncbi:MAG: hypothetical protein Kow0040_03590 [Thermogutta sp.]